MKALSELKKRSPSVVIHGNNVTQVYVEKKSFGTMPSTKAGEEQLRKSPSPNTELNSKSKYPPQNKTNLFGRSQSTFHSKLEGSEPFATVLKSS